MLLEDGRKMERPPESGQLSVYKSLCHTFDTNIATRIHPKIGCHTAECNGLYIHYYYYFHYYMYYCTFNYQCIHIYFFLYVSTYQRQFS